VTYIFWIFCGIIFFMNYFGWNFGTAYYLAMGTGLNIGPCEPAGINTRAVMIFQMCYFMLGSSVIAGCVGFFLSTVTLTKPVLFDHNWNDVSIFAKEQDGEVPKITVHSVWK
jgi:hypothetical protein